MGGKGKFIPTLYNFVEKIAVEVEAVQSISWSAINSNKHFKPLGGKKTRCRLWKFASLESGYLAQLVACWNERLLD